jgi:hypothetical protein
MSGDARAFNNIETRTVLQFFFLQVKAPEEIHAILTETLGKHAPSYIVVFHRWKHLWDSSVENKQVLLSTFLHSKGEQHVDTL